MSREYGKVSSRFWTDEHGKEHRVLAPQRLKWSSTGPRRLRDFVMRRDRGACVICGSTDEPVLDHRVSLKNGGTNHPDNLRCLCGACNARKVGLFDARRVHDLPHIAGPNWVASIDGDEARFGLILSGRSVSFSIPKDIAVVMSKAFLELFEQVDCE